MDSSKNPKTEGWKVHLRNSAYKGSSLNLKRDTTCFSSVIIILKTFFKIKAHNAAQNLHF